MVAFDSVGPSAAGSGGANPRSYTHTTVAASTTVIVGASLDGVAVGVTATCTIGGVSAVSLGQVAANGGTTGIVQAWYLHGVAAGAHTIVVTCATAGDIECGSMAYSAAGQLGTPFTNHSTVTGTTASVSVTSNTSGNTIAGFVACGDAVASTANTSRWINNFEGGAGQSTGNAAGADAAATGSTVTMSWTVAISPWAAIAVEVQPIPAPPPPPIPRLPPGWFPGSAAVTVDPGGIPFYSQPAPADATPGVTVLPTPEAAASPPPPLPPGWFPGADRVTAVPGGIPFEQLPPPLNPADAVVFPVPEVAGEVQWLPWPPYYFPGSQAVSVDPGGIPFYSQPQPLTAPIPPPPPPTITGQTGTGLGAYFSDQNGQPRLYVCAETWGLPANAGRWNGGNWHADYDYYHATRFSQGYTANVTHPWGHTHTGCNNDLGHTWDGIFPFLVAGAAADLTGQVGAITLNDPFWQRIDYMFASAAHYGITVFFDLAMSNDMPTGAGHGFTNGVFQKATTAQIQAAATAVATRYANTQNLVWFFGDDYYNDDDANFNAMWTGINAADPRIASCTSIEYYPTGNTARYDLSGAPGGETPHGWGNTHATYNFVYCYMQVYFGIEYAYTEPSPIGPVVWGDGMFWGNGGTSVQNDQLQRNNAWWALASGARGFVAEDEVVLQWGSTAAAVMTTDGLFPSTINNIYTLFSSLPGWWKLIPDTQNALVTAGRGTRAVYSGSEYLANTDTYVAASRVADGSLAVIYCAAAMSITIDQSKMAPGYTATWADPASGATAGTAAGSTYSSSGLGSNSAGGSDWVLILQGQPVAAPSNTGLDVWQPQPPGWFPGADRVTDLPGGIPFYVIPQPSDQNAAAGAGISIAMASAAGAASVTAAITQIAPATTAGTAVVSDVATQIAGAAAAGAGSVAALVTQVAPAAAAGAGAVTDVVTQVAPASAAGAGSVTDVATQIAGASAAGAGAAADVVTQIAAASAAGTGSVTDVVTQIATAAAAGAGVVTAIGSSSGAATANAAGAGSVAAVVTLIAPAAAAGASAAADVVTQVAGAAAAGAGAVADVVTQIAPAGSAGAGAVTDAVTQIATAAAAGAGSVTAAGTSSGAATASVAGAAVVTAVVTQIAPATAAGAGAIADVATQIAKATSAGAGAVNASGVILGAASVAGAAAAAAKAAQAAPAQAAAAAVLSALATQAATAALTAAGSVTAAGTVQLAFTVGTLTSATAAASSLTAATAPGASAGGTLTAATQRTGGPS